MLSGIAFEGLKRCVDVVAGERVQVRLVYLFGSQVSGEVGPLSDVDLGVLLAPNAPAARIRSQLAHDFSVALGGDPVDLIILNKVPVKLAYAVIAQGSIMYQRAPGEQVEGIISGCVSQLRNGWLGPGLTVTA